MIKRYLDDIYMSYIQQGLESRRKCYQIQLSLQIHYDKFKYKYTIV